MLRLEIGSEVWLYLNHIVDQGDHVAHTHDYLELAFILGGSADHYSVQGQQKCRAGDAIVVPRGAWHAYGNCRKLEIVNCLFSPRMLGIELAWLEEDEVLGALLGIRPTQASHQVLKLDLGSCEIPRLRGVITPLLEAYEEGASRVLIVGILLQLLHALREGAQAAFSAPERLVQDHPAVRRAIALMEETMAESWTLNALAERLGLNPSYLVRVFRQGTGYPPMKYLALRRAERAANLLLSTPMRVGEVGLAVGWADPKLFSRNFRQHFGLKAGEYRRKMLGSFRRQNGVST